MALGNEDVCVALGSEENQLRPNLVQRSAGSIDERSAVLFNVLQNHSMPSPSDCVSLRGLSWILKVGSLLSYRWNSGSLTPTMIIKSSSDLGFATKDMKTLILTECTSLEGRTVPLATAGTQ